MLHVLVLGVFAAGLHRVIAAGAGEGDGENGVS